MAKETKEAAAPAASTGANTEQTDVFIEQLQAQLKEQTEKHNFQKKRAEALEKSLTGAIAKVDERQKAIDDLREQTGSADGHDHVILGGVAHEIIGTFRADSTFVEVKRGHCEEGVTLVAIGKPH